VFGSADGLTFYALGAGDAEGDGRRSESCDGCGKSSGGGAAQGAPRRLRIESLEVAAEARQLRKQSSDSTASSGSAGSGGGGRVPSQGPRMTSSAMPPAPPQRSASGGAQSRRWV